MIVKLSISVLKDGNWREYLVRFVLGGATTVFTGIVSGQLGPAVGGLFLALPAILCASATLIEKHEQRRKDKAGLSGHRRGQEAAALDAAGASLGSVGMMNFALVFSFLVERNAPLALVLAFAAWGILSVTAWWIWRRLRLTGPPRVPAGASAVTNIARK